MDEARSKSLVNSYLPMRMVKRVKYFMENEIDALRQMDTKAIKEFFAVSAGLTATTVAMRGLAKSTNALVHKNLGTDSTLDFSSKKLDYSSIKTLKNKRNLTNGERAKGHLKSVISWSIYFAAGPVRMVIWINGTAQYALFILDKQCLNAYPKITEENNSSKTAFIEPPRIEKTNPETKFLEYLHTLREELRNEIEPINALMEKMKEKTDAAYESEINNTYLGRLNPGNVLRYYDKVNEIEKEFNYTDETRVALNNLRERVREINSVLHSMEEERSENDLAKIRMKNSLLYKRLYQQFITYMKEKLRPELEQRLGYCKDAFLQISSESKCFRDVYESSEVEKLQAVLQSQICPKDTKERKERYEDMIKLHGIEEACDETIKLHLMEKKLKSEKEQLHHQEAQNQATQNQKAQEWIAKRKLELSKRN